MRPAHRLPRSPFLRALIWGVLTANLWASMALAATPPASFNADEESPVMTVMQVSEHGYYVEGLSQLGSKSNQNFISNAGFVVTPEGVVVIDALGSPHAAKRLIKAIRQVTDKPITDVVMTHYHADHIYGLQAFKAAGAHITAHAGGKEYLASETARLRLQASRSDMAPWIDEQTRLVPADTWVDGPTSFTRGGVAFQITHVGPSHTPEDLAVYVPSEQLLYAGDLFFNGRLPFVGKANSGQWIQSLDKLLAFGAQVVVPGHGSASRTPKQDIEMTRDYLAYLRKTMGAAVENFVPFEQAYKSTDWSAFQNVPMFGPANRMNAYNTYLLMEQEALGKQD
ncbi:MBL fold metallo-hydrolase [Hydrogenophaga sp. 5NK40-0174]|uniref:MBL fold metallo-hydrolase n=1 Tax=Hydrogenophaga sp. 5NK40-0174 TaxID=3127649 RepID=UPI003107B363